jgi:hypothetical protein
MNVECVVEEGAAASQETYSHAEGSIYLDAECGECRDKEAHEYGDGGIDAEDVWYCQACWDRLHIPLVLPSVLRSGLGIARTAQTDAGPGGPLATATDAIACAQQAAAERATAFAETAAMELADSQSMEAARFASDIDALEKGRARAGARALADAARARGLVPRKRPPWQLPLTPPRPPP